MNQKEKSRVQVKKVIERTVERDEQNNIYIYFALYDFGYKFKESLCTLLWRIIIGS